jgi:hypothetical protein
MAGKGMVLTERDRAVLRDVAELELVSRPQFQRRKHFGSRTRANAVLARLVRFGYLATRRQPVVGGSRRVLYHLGPVGQELLGIDSNGNLKGRRMKQLSDLFIEHHLRTNDVRLGFWVAAHPQYSFDRWITDAALRPLNLGLVPDGYVEYRHSGLSFAAFVELDLGTETLGRWEGKTREYLKLAYSGAFRSAFKHHYFRVLVITSSPGRLQSLQKTIGRITPKIFWLTTIDDVYRDGPMGLIWHRPQGTTLHSLTEP